MELQAFNVQFHCLPLEAWWVHRVESGNIQLRLYMRVSECDRFQTGRADRAFSSLKCMGSLLTMTFLKAIAISPNPPANRADLVQLTSPELNDHYRIGSHENELQTAT